MTNKDRLLVSSEELDLNKSAIAKLKTLNEDYKNKTGHGPNVLIKTYGCQMNEHDSENLLGMLEDMGYTETCDENLADLIIFNTCCIRENAEMKVYGNLGQLKSLKRSKPDLQIAVCGCMMQRSEIVKSIRKKYTFVNIIFGTHNIYNFPSLLLKSTKSLIEKVRLDSITHYDSTGKIKKKKHKLKPVIEVWDVDGKVAEGLPSHRKYESKAFVNIMYGCNNYCTYCIVPYTRGRERSRSLESIVSEVAGLVQSGVKEVTLLGQNVNSYGDERFGFADLLAKVNEIEGLERIRFMTSHPKDISKELIDMMSRLDKVCEHLHLPVQSGSNSVLERMNRRYTREKYIETIEYARKKIPNLSLSTDIIVGFPGETDEDAIDTINLVNRIEFDTAYTFIYSRREGTPADKFPDHVDDEIKQKRFSHLLETMNDIIIRKNKLKAGNVYEVLVESKSKTDDSCMTGRSRGFDTVNFKGDESLIGKTVRVKITDPKNFSLNGEIIDSD